MLLAGYLEVVEIGAAIEVEAQLVVVIDITHPRRETGASTGFKADRQQLVEGIAAVGDDVYNAAAGAVARRRVAQHLDALDTGGWQCLDVLLQCLDVHIRRAVVNPNFHGGLAAVGDVALGIHFHARGVLEGIAGGACLHAGVVLHVVEGLFAIGAVKAS